ncbi:hypothetical protein DFS33DRAFT_1117236 [Desarmillaria ectypa]|nr:hypothetical protein DFS33DRAFT_1117236 [Desarmillaria ectypa]
MAPSQTEIDAAIQTVRKAYFVVFRKQPPARDRDNYLLLWKAVYSGLGVHVDLIDDLKKALPSLSKVTWEDVAKVLNLDPSRGNEQFSKKSIQNIYLPHSFIKHLLDDARTSLLTYGDLKEHKNERQHVQLASFIIRAILKEFGGIIHDTAEERLPASDTSSGGPVEVELRIKSKIILLIAEFKKRIGLDPQHQVLAQAVAESTCVDLWNRSLGYTFPIHAITIDLKETTVYTWDPKTETPSIRVNLECAEFVHTDDEEYIQSFLRMVPVLTRLLFSIVVEGYGEYIKAKLSQLTLPETLKKPIAMTKTIHILQGHEFTAILRANTELPGPIQEGSESGRTATAEMHRHEQHVTAICHALLSHVGFIIAPKHLTSKKLELSQGTTTPCARVLTYSIKPLQFNIIVQIVDIVQNPEVLEGTVPNVIISMRWRHSSTTQENEIVAWTFPFAQYFDNHKKFPSQFRKVEDSGFHSAALYKKFVHLMQQTLLQPLWQKIHVHKLIRRLRFMLTGSLHRTSIWRLAPPTLILRRCCMKDPWNSSRRLKS